MSPPGAAKLEYRAVSALRRRGKANGRAKFHHCLIEIARILTTEQVLGGLPHARAGDFDSPGQARDHTLNIPIHYRHWLVESDTSDRGGCISTDPRESLEFSRSARKFACMIANNLSGS